MFACSKITAVNCPSLSIKNLQPELFFGLAKESLVVIAAVTMLFIFFKENFGYSILYLIPILGVVYGLLWWVAFAQRLFSCH
jgi:xanthine/uracil permease